MIKMKIQLLMSVFCMAFNVQGAIWSNVGSFQAQTLAIAQAFLYNGTGTVSLPPVTATYFCTTYNPTRQNLYGDCSSNNQQLFPVNLNASISISGTPYMLVELPSAWTVTGGGAVKSGNSWYIPYGGHYSGTHMSSCQSNLPTGCTSFQTLQGITLSQGGGLSVKTTEADGSYTFTGKVSMFIDPYGMTAPMYNGVNIHFTYNVKNNIPYNPDGPTPKDPVTCTHSNLVQISHGTMLLSEVNGHTKKERLNVTCSGGKAIAVLTLQGNWSDGLSSVDVGRNVLSKNGISLQQDGNFAKSMQVTFNTGLNSVYIKSSLTEKAGGAMPGSILGSDILTISYN